MITPQYKIIADHLRSSSFLICDGILPSNEGRGYVLRRIMRRAMLQIHKIGANKSIMHKFVPFLIHEMSSQYPELSKNQNLIETTFKNEEDKFRETLEKGLKILNEEISKAKSNNTKISGSMAFKLYDTYGFPLDLTQDIIKDHKLEVDLEEFEKEMEIQRNRARESWSGNNNEEYKKIFFEIEDKIGSTNFIGYEKEYCEAIIKEIVTIDDEKIIILDKTPFYATSGGQRGDNGFIILADEFNSKNYSLTTKQNFAEIIETKKFGKNLYGHFTKNINGDIKIGDKVVALIDSLNRQTRAQGHSATHLLNKALKELIDKNISQKGSSIEYDYFTFDFNLNRNLKDEEIFAVEDLVNFYIRQNSKTEIKNMMLNDALESGAEAMFGSKYEDQVRVLKIGPSVELCGGTHVEYTGNIGLFKIISETGIASGIRRITAKVGSYAIEYNRIQEQKLKSLITSLKINYHDNYYNRVLENLRNGYKQILDFPKKLDNDNYSNVKKAEDDYRNIGDEIDKIIKDKDKVIINLKKQQSLNAVNNKTPDKINDDINLLWHLFENIDAKDLRQITNDCKNLSKFSKSHIIIFFSVLNDKVFVCVAISDDLIDKLNANDIIKNIIKNIGGNGGGGQRNFAMGGGNDKNSINVSIEKLKQDLKNAK